MALTLTKAKAGSKNNGKGVAFEKRAKMDKAQQEILMICCLVSAIIGFTLVGATFLIRNIIYNAKIVDANNIVIDTYKDIQNSLKSIETQINGLASNENLESVARHRDSDRCSKYAANSDLHNISAEELELVKTCSSLRVIADAMPSSNNMEATLSSLNQLINISNDGTGVGFDGLSEMRGSTTTSMGFKNVTKSQNDTGETVTIHAMNTSLKLTDSATKILSALSVIESSIRNFDIVQAQLRFNGDELELTSTFSAYYSDEAELGTQERVVCADVESEECSKKGGDTAEKEKKTPGTRNSEEAE